jgi:hypothetical protein
MKRVLIPIVTCAVILFNLFTTGAAQAQSLLAISIPGLPNIELTPQQQDMLKQLETDILPQLDEILYPEQREQLKSLITDGTTSFRKAFKSLTLSPDQKEKLGALLKSLPKKDVFASLTPDQKKQLFLKKKEFFTPTPEEISERISAKMKLAKDKGAMMPTPEEIAEKISAKMSMMKGSKE